MRLIFLRLLITSPLLLILACNQGSTSNDAIDSTNPISAKNLGKHIEILASDSFMGRKPFTESETKTINYLKDQFAAIGIEAGNGDSYFQEVPMVNVAVEAAASMQVESPKGSFALKGFDDYVIWTDKVDPTISLTKVKLFLPAMAW